MRQAEQHVQPAGWLEALGRLSLVLACVCAVIVVVDIFGRGHRQKMWIMDVVYPVTALYWGPVALWFYFRHGRADAPTARRRESGEPPAWSMSSKAIGHCGAGCTLGDIAAE